MRKIFKRAFAGSLTNYAGLPILGFYCAPLVSVALWPIFLLIKDVRKPYSMVAGILVGASFLILIVGYIFCPEEEKKE